MFFSAGMATATWDIQIVDDGVLEDSENLVVYISDPVNAILGRKRKTRIRLINAENGNMLSFFCSVTENYITVINPTLNYEKRLLKQNYFHFHRTHG